MGRRARGRGVTGAALRAARRVAEERGSLANAVAARVYAVATEREEPPAWVRDRPDGEATRAPLAVWAPVTAAGEVAGEALVRRFGMARDDATVRDVASYLLTVWLTAYEELTPERLEAWRRSVAAARDAAEGSSSV